MDISTARAIPILDFLQKMGFHPTRERKGGRDVWFFSPLRPGEKEASFHVNTVKNRWFDFGGGQTGGGDVIELAEKLWQVNFQTALSMLEKVMKAGEESPIRQPLSDVQLPGNQSKKEADHAFLLEEIRPDFAPSLDSYLRQTRKINLEAACDFIRQIHFKDRAGKPFFAVGMANDAGGWEVRNPFFKSCVGPKGMSFFRGRVGEDGLPPTGVAVFEGMFDFLSALSFFGKATMLETDVLVLHSLAFLPKAIDFLEKRPEYMVIKLFFDNDEAGENAFSSMKESLVGRLVEPSFAIYHPFKDFNEYLIAWKRG